MGQDEVLALIEQAAAEGWTELDLSGKGLREIPAEIGKLTQLETLILGKAEKWEWFDNKPVPKLVANELTKLPSEIAMLKNLKKLHLSSNPFKEIPQVVFQLRQLRSLALVSIDLPEIPESLSKLANLNRLYLSNNQIIEIPESLSKLTNLNRLYLSNNQIIEIPESLSKLINLNRLYLSGNQIIKISESLSNLTNLTRLYLSNNQIAEIPESLSKLTNLTRLSFSNNQIAEIPESLFKLTKLTELYISNNKITGISESLNNLTNLKEFYLSGNQIIEMPDVIANLTKLTGLYLSNNKITQIPDAITKLSSLITLDISYNQITEIPDAIAQLFNLTTLDLDSNQITEIPDVISQLSNLRKLDLYNNLIKILPQSLTKLNNLTRLSLTNNQITEIPESLNKLTNLTEFYISNNEITEIPEALTKLTNLIRLSLANNQITEIPESLNKLTNLAEFYLYNNQITTIPKEITNLTSLTHLHLSYNQIIEIPEEIANLTSLTELDLNGNQITEIPEAIGNLTSLTELYLSYNQITEIPEAIGNLTSLTSFYLRSNEIIKIPEAISNLTSLTSLYLSENQITGIPDFLESLPKLEKLDLRCNPLPISPEILGSSQEPGSVADIFNYLNLLRSGNVRPLNEAKLLLVGQGSVGKTSLIERLIHNRYNPNQPQTDGLNVEPWQVQVNSKDVRLNVWDFGGQEIYHATHQFFLTKRSLYLLVCNCRTSEEENRIEYWLKLITSFGDASPVIIVGNKKDEQPFDINRKALREKYPNIQAIIETSCQDNLGIDELRKAIFGQVAGLKEVYDLLPLPWFEVKEHLEAMTQDFISYSTYLNICIQKQISEEQNQEQLIDLLHRLGLVLNFRQHPLLQSTKVLKPDWVTEGIYTLLSDETLKTIKKGIFTYADLNHILDPQRYPEERHKYLIELMKEFELCFALDGSSNRFLIPGLLPKDEPEDTELEGETLEFQYHYQVLPPSIISRFIVLTHEKIHNQTYWRSGVMLEDKEGKETLNIARIKTDPEDKKIFITISGREQTRRSFLKTIRDVFKKIHNSFANLEITEYVPVPNHPDHPPLDYQELLGLEDMGESEVKIGKLKLKINLRQLLDGYESLIDRQKHLGNYIKEQNNYYQYGDGDNFVGDQVGHDKRR
ncbi:MAG: GTP-binding protein [Coleofasciculaceae cyanobacterium SM2_1_6]|nr:GTP-binding protein [Coleofasciculaceae cyanobacterium SM2_1_6]